MPFLELKVVLQYNGLGVEILEDGDRLAPKKPYTIHQRMGSIDRVSKLCDKEVKVYTRRGILKVYDWTSPPSEECAVVLLNNGDEFIVHNTVHDILTRLYGITPCDEALEEKAHHLLFLD